jgi:WD40 repeat protein
VGRVLIAIAFFLVSFAAQAEKRVALVIGNSAYQTAPALPNPVRDAKAIAEALREAGFADVTEGYDLSKAKFDEALKRFGDAAADADWALIFYAGHGIGIGGETYVLPVDAALKRADHADDEAISLSRLRAKAGGAKALRMVILDSCRENPFAARLAADRGAKRAISRGLPAPSKPEGDELIAYATRENDVADDGDGTHSPFTAAFLQHLREPALEVRFLFGKVRDTVRTATSRQQTPTTYGDLGGAYFYFRPPQAQTSTPKSQPPLSEAAEAWRTVEHSDSEAVLEEFTRRFPDSVYAGFAKARLQELRAPRNALAVLKSDPINTKPPVTAVAPAKPAEEAPKPAPAMQYEDAARHLVRSFAGHTGTVTSVALSPDGRFALSGGCDDEHWDGCKKGSVKLWDIASGREVRSFGGHTKLVLSVAFSPDGRFAFSGSEDRTLRVWDIATGHKLSSFNGHKDLVDSVAISKDGRTAIFAGIPTHVIGVRADTTLKLWDIASGRELRSFIGHPKEVHSVALSSDGRAALSGSMDSTLKLWDITSGRELRTFHQPMLVQSVAFSPDGRTALVSRGTLPILGELILFDITSGRDLRNFVGHKGCVASVAFSPDGRAALSGDYKGELKLWDVASGRELRSFSGHRGWIRAVAFSPDGRSALSGSYDKTLKLWDISEWTQPQEAHR